MLFEAKDYNFEYGKFITTAPTHALQIIHNFFVRHGIEQLWQPPYSSDKAPCDFWLFPSLKCHSKEGDVMTQNTLRPMQWSNLSIFQKVLWKVFSAKESLLRKVCYLRRDMFWRGLGFLYLVRYLYFFVHRLDTLFYHTLYISTLLQHMSIIICRETHLGS